MTKKQKLSPAAVGRVIRGVPFPSSKRDIVEYARNKGGNDGTIAALERLSGDVYSREEEITSELDSILDTR